MSFYCFYFFFSGRRRHTRYIGDWSSDVCSSDLILKVERGVVRVADAKGQPPTIPFWLGEGPSRTAELSAEIAELREQCTNPQMLEHEIGLPPEAAVQIADYIADGRRTLGTVPTQKRVILERF